MSRSLLWPDPRVKPPFGAAEIDWGHRLALNLEALWLMNEGGGVARSMGPGRVMSGAATWGSSRSGLVTGASGDQGQNSQLAFGTNASFSLATGHRAITDSYIENCTYGNFYVSNSDCGGYALGLSPSSDGPNVHYVLHRNNNQGGGVALASDGWHTKGSARTLNTDYSVGVSLQLGTAVKLYINGALDTTNTSVAATVGYGSTGARPASALTDAHVWYSGIWSRLLTPDDFLWLHAEPYAMLRPIVRRRYFVPSADIINPYNPWLHRGPVLAQ